MANNMSEHTIQHELHLLLRNLRGPRDVCCVGAFAMLPVWSIDTHKSHDDRHDDLPSCAYEVSSQKIEAKVGTHRIMMSANMIFQHVVAPALLKANLAMYLIEKTWISYGNIHVCKYLPQAQDVRCGHGRTPRICL